MSSQAGPSVNMTANLREDLFPGNEAAYRDLQAIKKVEETIGFVGAGVSAPLYPMWTKLLNNLADDIVARGFVANPQDIAAIKLQIQNDPLEAATSIEEAYTRSVFRSKFASVFRQNNDQFTATHEAIVRLGLSGVTTLNYDEGLENAYSHVHRKTYNTIRMDDRTELTRWIQRATFSDARKPLVHLHGVSNDPNSMIITADDYNRHYADSAVIDFIKQLWLADRLLVVGFGFTDPFLTHVAEGVLRSLPSETRHFALIGIRTEEPISTLQRRQFVRKYRLTPIFYQIRGNADGSEDHSDLLLLLNSLAPDDTSGGPSDKSTAISNPANPGPTGTSLSKLDPNADLRSEFQSQLLIAPTGVPLYIQPRIYAASARDEAGINAERVQIPASEIWTTDESYLIYCGPEYGASTLCRKIALECASRGDQVVLRDARSLPNYKKKLQDEFKILQGSTRKTLVLDNFDVERHERMMNELRALNLFDKYVICADKTRDVDLVGSNAGPYGQNFKIAQLSSLERTDIRFLAKTLFDSDDIDYVSSIVEKVYTDLLQLCIPLTPLNVIMYLRIIHKEGDFTPLNRIQILDRYVHQLLSKPSDDYRYALNARGKIDLVSAFVYQLFSNQETSCTELDWFNFCRKYKSENLISFDERELLNDLDRQKVFLRLSGNIVFRYRLFYAYFLGRHVANRESILDKFLGTDHHISTEGLVDSISNFSSDNTKLIEDLVQKLNTSIETFHSTYIPSDFDPFAGLTWVNDSDEGETWKPLMQAIEAGPASTEELDKLKSSWFAERRTEDQTVVIRRFNEIERKLLAYHYALANALVCAENATGASKVAAAKALYKGWRAIYQVALCHAPLIARNRYYVWNGLLFHNEMKYSDEDTIRERTMMVLFGSVRSISDQACELIGSRKLGEVFRHISATSELTGFRQVLNYALLLRSKPGEWEQVAKNIILSVDRNTYYMRSLLMHTFHQYKDEVNTHGDREKLKYLMAVIRARRDMKSNNPSSSLIKRVLDDLEKANVFEDPAPEVNG
ncbi:SIR2 family protein [Methylobacterium sp. Leaf361]|uniref:SIR2 family protein n=1 Tax=Methylobacterium sp. Leaf361 TaxID=1736352 RepID=UPI0009EB574D|nr:SIR2 family protein [Methylobacterium sp. Leaf361]